MKKHIIILALAIPAFIGCQDNANKETTETTATDTMATTSTAPATEAPAPPMDSAAQMKAWEEYMTPGDVHKMMASWDGKWTSEVTMWMSPDAPPSTSTATSDTRMVLGGRYQETVSKGNFNGMPFEGKGYLAYDNSKKVFVSSWMDNMGTGIMHLEGPWDEASKSMTLTGECVDPTTGKNMTMKEVVKIVDEKNQVMEMYCNQGGKEYKSMEMKMTRK